MVLGLDLVEKVFTQAIMKLSLDSAVCQVYQKLDGISPQEEWSEVSNNGHCSRLKYSNHSSDSTGGIASEFN